MDFERKGGKVSFAQKGATTTKDRKARKSKRSSDPPHPIGVKAGGRNAEKQMGN